MRGIASSGGARARAIDTFNGPREAYQSDWSHDVVLPQTDSSTHHNTIEAEVGRRYSGRPPAASTETAASMADMPFTEGKASGTTP